MFAMSWGYRHRYLTTGIRIAVAIWNLIVGAALLAHGYLGWGLLELAVSASIFVAAYLYARRYSAVRRSGRS
jgi:hypothetical protein